jgi:putative ABC transport system permease protein
MGAEKWIYTLPLRLRSLFWRLRVDQELDDELRNHVARKTEENITKGMTPEDARRAALLEMCGIERAKEECRDARHVNWLQDLAQDLRYGLRMLRRSPGFTLVAVLTLGLGMGANTAIFSVVDGVLIRALPYTQPNRLVGITDSYPQGALVAMQSNLHSMEVAGYEDGRELNLTGLGDPVRLYGTAVSANFFSLLGVRPDLGRTFLIGEDQPGKDDVVILSHALWQDKFGGDPRVIGRSVTWEGESRQIVGVMPQGFQFAASKAQFWVPLHLDSRTLGAYWGSGFMPVVGRLKAGVTREQACAELQADIPQMRMMFPWKMPDALWAGSSVVPLQAILVGDVAPKLTILLGATCLVLLIACVNVANLYLARASVREKEMSVRAVLGAGRWRIGRQLLTESIVLAICGGGVGLLFARKGLSWLQLILPADTPRLGSISVDWRVMAFTAGIAVTAGLLFGVAPAFHASRSDLSRSLKTGLQHSMAATSRHVRSALVITEVALAVVLVISAGLLVKTLWELAHVYPGFRSESVLTARITPSEAFCADFERCRSFYNELLERTRALPGVVDAALTDVLPLEGRLSGFAAGLEDHPQDPREPAPVLFETIITPGYVRLMGIPLLRGRAFSTADSAPDAPPVALITAATARKYWPNQDPIGKHLKRVWASDWTTVVGVVGDIHEYSLAAKLPDYADGAIYEPYGNGVRDAARLSMAQPTEMTLLLRVTTDQASIASQSRDAVSSLNPDVPVSRIQTFEAVISESQSGSRSTASLFSIFAALALLLGAIGIYGVVSYSVEQRTAEIGLRVALGAGPNNILRLVIGQGARLSLAGVAMGIAGACGVTRLISGFLFGVSPTDPITFAAVALLLVGVSALACCIPARRAMRLDPMVALRHE